MSTRCNIEFYHDEPGEFAEPAARIYKHSDGYPEGILPMLKELEETVGQNAGMYGKRTDDPEWCAAEFISKFRPEGGGNIYVSQQLHGDIDYLYRVICGERFKVAVFTPKHDGNFNVVSFAEVTE